MKTRCITTAKSTKPRESRSKQVSVILLCDNPGYRMKSYGPLSLVTVANSRLIDYQIKSVQQYFPNFELIMCLGFDAEKICRYVRANYSGLPIRIIENQLFDSSNACESVRLALNNTFNDRVIICSGNLLFGAKVFDNIDYKSTCVITEKAPCENLEVGMNVDTNGEVQHFSFGADKIWSEILYLHGKDAVEDFRKIVSQPTNKNKFVFEALNDFLAAKHTVRCVVNTSPLRKINNIKTYHAIRGTK
jgi:CTP:phosphocholine cytidylyltransferase-like protein